MSSNPPSSNSDAGAAPAAPIAIIGIGCLFPGASGKSAYWANLVAGRDAISDVPESHWSVDDYFDADPSAPDRTYGRRGGFLEPVDFSPLGFSIQPNALEATDTSQLLGLVAADMALRDAGCHPDTGADHSRSCVILGVTGALELVVPLGARLGHPKWRRALAEAGASQELSDEVVRRISAQYVDWQEASFPGLLGNVVAGRIANRFDFGGTNCVVDAACASSLSALHLASLELATGRADIAVTGGVDTFNDIFMYMCFSKTPALSPSGNARPFDEAADGTVLGEGLGMVVLKRLSDAERDGDRIYAVVRGLGSSSDGRGQAIYAPSSAGQMRALRRAYEAAAVDPGSVELVEGHGTGTAVGDAVELRGLCEVFQGARSGPAWCAVGSVKSQIGHTKAAAGAAGLIKAALALYHKVLPPTIKVDTPSEAVSAQDSPFYLNTRMRPWLPSPEHPRRAGVSSFGFGGSNFHCVLEEHRPEKVAVDWSECPEIIALSGPDRAALLSRLNELPSEASVQELRSVASQSRAAFRSEAHCRLLLVIAPGETDLQQLVAQCRSMLQRADSGPNQDPRRAWSLPSGAYFAQGAPDGDIAFLFPGQGAQYPDMLRGLACRFPEMQSALAAADRIFGERAEQGVRLSDAIFPPTAFDEATREAQVRRLRSTRVAQPALGAVSAGALAVFSRFGVRPGFAAGHSYGELTALFAAGRWDQDTLFEVSCVRGGLMASGDADRGGMVAVQATLEPLQALIAAEKLELTVANHNAPQQIVLSGRSDEVERAVGIIKAHGLRCTKLSVSAAFHSPLVADVRAPFAQALAAQSLVSGRIPVYANSSAAPYPDDADAARELLASQLARPVEFQREIRALHEAGVRSFVEIGPGARLSGLVRSILADREHHALALDASGGRNGLQDLARALAQLAALGHQVELSRWAHDASAQPASLPKKPAFSVQISGANYVSPKKPKQPARVSREVRSVMASQTNKPSMPEPSLPEPSRPASVPAAIPAAEAQQTLGALGMIHQSLAHLQKIQEQTASLHRQFLEGQETAQRSMQMLIAQQHALLHQSLGLAGPQGALPAPAPALMPSLAPAPLPTPVQPVQAAPAPAAPAPVARPAVQTEQPAVAASSPSSSAAETLLEVVALTTGYPVEMLELDMSLDSDLGIDSIKRVEILSALQERLPGLPAVRSEQMGFLGTLRDIVEMLASSSPAASPDDPELPATSASVAGSESVERITELVLGVVAETTGYPQEMLELDMSLDADLGIDSIKRVEILSRVQELLPDLPAVGSEAMGELRSLRDVVGLLYGASGDAAPPATASTPVVAMVARSSGEPVDRYILVRQDLNGARPALRWRATQRAIWVVDDGAIASRLVELLRAQGFAAALLMLGEAELPAAPAALSGLVILAPQAGADDAFLLRSFGLVQHCAAALAGAAREDAGLLLTVSRQDGMFGLAGHGNADPIAGGLAGLVKTFRHEWPQVVCRALDLAPTLDTATAAESIAEEVGFAGPLELGIQAHGRGRLTLQPAPSDATPSGLPLVGSGDVVVVSGGARGVTAEAAVALAERWQPTLLLLGRSPIPEAEPSWLAELQSEQEIKRAIAQPGETPRALAERCRSLLAAREIRGTIARIEQAGARAVYRSVDVRDAEAVQRVLGEARAQHGPIRGWIHGAGVLADRMIADKTAEQFERVYQTKVAGLRSLLQATADDDLAFCVVYSSSTARFGRKGQVDYGVANEVANKLAQREAARRPGCRVLALNWGPWDGGMVTPGLRELFLREGVPPIGLDAGVRALFAELLAPGPAHPVEVVLLGAGSKLPDQALPARPLSAPAVELPLAFAREVRVETHPVLADHVMQGRAVVPVALLLEWLSHGALHGNPGLWLHGIDELRVLRGLILAGQQSRQVQVLAGRARQRDGIAEVPVELRSTDEAGTSILHARARVALRSEPSLVGEAQLRSVEGRYEFTPEACYERFLFHGPLLQGIEQVEACGPEGITGFVRASTPPTTWMQQPLRGRWIADPLALDAAFQLMILWSWQHNGAPSLPTAVGCYRQFARAFPRDGVRVLARIRRASPGSAQAEIEFLSRSGALVARITDYDCVIDASLADSFRRNSICAGDPSA